MNARFCSLAASNSHKFSSTWQHEHKRKDAKCETNALLYSQVQKIRVTYSISNGLGIPEFSGTIQNVVACQVNILSKLMHMILHFLDISAMFPFNADWTKRFLEFLGLQGFNEGYFWNSSNSLHHKLTFVRQSLKIKKLWVSILFQYGILQKCAYSTTPGLNFRIF